MLDDELDHVQFGIMGTTNLSIKSTVPKSWILLDNASTVDVFSNPSLVRNIRSANWTLRILCAAGTAYMTYIPDFLGYRTIWFLHDSFVNILSLQQMKQHYQVTYDLGGITLDCFIVHKSKEGLFYLDSQVDLNSMAFVTMVEGMESLYSTHDICNTKATWKLQCIIGQPNSQYFQHLIENNLLPGCHLTADDVKTADHIYGCDLGSIKGKTVQSLLEQVKIPISSIPPDLMTKYQCVILAVDVMFVNKIPFFITTSHDIKFNTVERLGSQTNKVFMALIQHVLKIYNAQGFKVDTILGDGQFEPLHGELATLGTWLNTTSRDEHMLEVERYTHMERVRACYNTLLSDKYPCRLIIKMVYTQNFWLNAFPHVDGISQMMSPKEIIAGFRVNFLQHCKVEFGDYVQTHEEHTNDMKSCTIGALSLWPTGNSQGGYYFYSLTILGMSSPGNNTPSFQCHMKK